MKLLGSYQNGNYTVSIYDDGTKIRENDLDNLTPAFPESIDLKICDRCDMGCAMCHEASTPDGKLGDIMNLRFIDSMHPYTEIAIGGGNPLEHPDLMPFLKKLKDKNILASMTVNGRHFLKELDQIKRLKTEGLIRGLGVSYSTNLSDVEKVNVVENLSDFPDSVLHVINGMIDITDLKNIAKCQRVLVLGYKNLRRGETYLSSHEQQVQKNMKMLAAGLKSLMITIPVLAFDNLALTQLNVRKIVGEDTWNNLYMGGDGQYTMYVDGVKEEFAISSTSKTRYKITDNLTDMFNVIRR